MRTLRWLAIVVGCLMIVSLAGYFHLVGQVESQIERIASRLATTGRLSWHRIQIHPRGEVRLHDVRFEPREFRDSIRIEEIVFRSRNLPALAHAIREVNQGRIPNGLSLRVRSGRLPIARPFNDWLDGRFFPGIPWASAGCDYQEQQFRALNQLDYWELVIEAQLDYQLVLAGEQLDLRGRLTAGRLTDWNIRVRLGLEDTDWSIHQLSGQLTSADLINAELEFTDLGFQDRLHNHCMSMHGEDANTWQEHHLPAWRQAWANNGLALDDVAEAAYRTFLADPGSIGIEAQPDPPLPMAKIEAFSFSDTLPQLNTMVRVNDSAPVTVRFAPVTPPPSVQLEPESPEAESRLDELRIRPAPELIDPTTQALPPPPVPPGWKSVPLDSADAFVGSRVRLLLVDETQVSGTLVDTDEQALYLEIRSRFGLLARPFARHRIADLRVPDNTK